ncbi:MAG: hypothetical protein LBR73_07300 [Oscillospiraceae bacterium]|jgi:ppGpp synthetase/RelA/SpoT-type nucleotidyltranferase|nr:hypothetical protein [Oscillospiraceae bacterium]
MEPSPTLQKAEALMRRAHEGQTDKAGQPYYLHPLAVAALVDGEEAKAVALLHDVSEDCGISAAMLKTEGFHAAIVETVQVLERRPGDNYWDYLRRIADYPLAVQVKLADLAHNSDRSRLPDPTPADEARYAKYAKATAYLLGIQKLKAERADIDFSEAPYKFLLHRRLYALLRPDYIQLAADLQENLQREIHDICPGAIVQSRAKNLDSFTEKCVRKAKKYGTKHFEMMTDLCGVRVIVQTLRQVDDVCAYIKETYEIDWPNSEDAGARLGSAEFGYRSQHFVVIADGRKAEIQVRTFAQHINADTLHDRMYKSAITPTKDHERGAARIAAQLDNADILLDEFVSGFDFFSLNQTTYRPTGTIEADIAILRAINSDVSDPNARLENSLKIARLLRSLCAFEEILSELKAYDAKENPDWLFEYGIALCASEENRLKGAKFVKQALDAYSKYEQDNTAKWQKQKRQLISLLLSAGRFTGKAVYYERVLAMDSSNPYAAAELIDGSLKGNQLTFRAAAKRAKAHLAAHINEPDIYFILGHLQLALGEEHAALEAFLDGLLFFRAHHADENKPLRRAYEREILKLTDSENDIADCVYQLAENPQPGELIIIKDAGGEALQKIKIAALNGTEVICTHPAAQAELIRLDNPVLRKFVFTLPDEPESLAAFRHTPTESLIQGDSLTALAKKSHEDYVSKRLLQQRNAEENLADWENLRETYKTANRSQVADEVYVFESCGFSVIQSAERPENALTYADLTAAEQEKLARAEHGRWNADKVRDGWLYAPKRDNARKLHPCLVAFDRLPPEIQKYDYDKIEETMKWYAEVGVWVKRG